MSCSGARSVNEYVRSMHTALCNNYMIIVWI